MAGALDLKEHLMLDVKIGHESSYVHFWTLVPWLVVVVVCSNSIYALSSKLKYKKRQTIVTHGTSFKLSMCKYKYSTNCVVKLELK